MTTISSIGPVSGINYGSLITGLTATDQAQITSITNRLTTLSNQNDALNALNVLMTSLKVSSANFMSSKVFRATTASSSNTSVLNATAGTGTPTGTYSFNVQRVASATQMVTQGFADSSTALGLSGTMTFGLGGGTLDKVASLSSLNGGSGVARGSVRITDGSGASTLVNLSDAVDINDVITSINSASGINVAASVDGDHLVLTDNSGGSGTIKVANSGGTTTASDLGLTGAASGTALTGTSLTKLSSTSTLASLNDGNGVRSVSGKNDFSITNANGTVNISLGSAKSLADVIKTINDSGSSDGISAAISSDGSGITLSSSDGGNLSVSALNSSFAAYDLGIQSSGTGGTLVGSRVATTLSGPLLRDLNGGYSSTSSTIPQAGKITINGQVVDLSSATSLNDVIKGINQSGQGVTAALNSSGTGVTLSSSSSTFTIADSTGNLASFLHISGTSTAAATGSQISSGSLHLQKMSSNTLLSTLNAGAGIPSGSISMTDGNGASATLDLSGKNIATVGDVINAINGAGLAISARVNDNGDGILLSQTGGTLNATITDTGGTSTATKLGIAGTFSNNKLDGSLTKTLTISTTDTLTDISTKINNLGAGVAASVLNDGSGANGYRLSLSSRNSGFAGALVFDGSAAGITTTSLVKGQDAVVVYGGNANGTGGLTTTSASNTITGLVPSMTLNLTGAGSTSVSVTSDTSKVASTVQDFVDSYNKVISNIATATAFNATDTTQNGVLFGNSTVQQVQNAMGAFVNKQYTGYGSVNSLASVGITVGQDGTLTLDSDTLNAAIAANPTDVQNLFMTNTAAVAANSTTNPPTLAKPAVKGIGATLSDVVSQFSDSQTGILFDATTALSTQNTQLTDRKTQLQTLLASKQNVLLLQFANLESNISNLQSQQTTITSWAASLSSSA